MSFLHITHKGKKATIYLEDGKSDLLDRYVDVDSGAMYYTIGKQITGKPINPNGKTGIEILRIAKYWVNNPETEWSTALFSGGGKSDCFIATAAYGSTFTSEIKLLCYLRDNILFKNRTGILFVRFYYAISPSISRIVASHLFLASSIRYFISGLHKYNLLVLKWHCRKRNHFMRLNQNRWGLKSKKVACPPELAVRDLKRDMDGPENRYYEKHR